MAISERILEKLTAADATKMVEESVAFVTKLSH